MSDIVLSDKQKQRLLERSIASNSKLDVQLRGLYFSPVDGVQHNVEILANESGTFYNIAFIEGEKMTLPGNMASKLIEDFPNKFKLISVDGELVDEGKTHYLETRLMKQITEKLMKDYTLVKKKPTESNRDRSEEKVLLKDKEE